MRGTYFLGNGAFETRDMPEHPLAPREVLIRVAACGVCGTDVHIYHGDKGSAEVIPPVVFADSFLPLQIALRDHDCFAFQGSFLRILIT